MHTIIDLSNDSPPARADTAFQRATRAQRTADGAYRASIQDSWSMDRGPNGGYLAALLLNTLLHAHDDPSHRPRSFHVRFVAGATSGNADLRTRVERRGRSMAWLSGELVQGDRLCASASLATSTAREAITYEALNPPRALPDPHAIAPLRLPGMPAITRHYDYRNMYATPLAASSERVGGFLRLREAQPIDAVVLSALSDAWFPASYARDPRLISAVTVDLTLHFRNHDVLRGLAPDAYVYAAFRSRHASEGFVDEDGELWTQDGKALLAQSRQLRLAHLATVA